MNQFFQSLQRQPSPKLQHIVTQEAMMRLIEDDEDGEIKKALIEHLPEGQ